MSGHWLDYDKVNKFLFNIYLKTRGQGIGSLRKVLDGDDWLITDGYIAFRIPDDKLFLKPSFMNHPTEEVAKFLKVIFSVNPESQRILWTPHCVLDKYSKKVQRFYKSSDQKFAVLMPDELLQKVNNSGYLLPYSTGKISAVQLADHDNKTIHAIIMPCKYDDEIVTDSILPVVTST